MSETSKDTENLGGEAALARPYARAVFELAKSQGNYQQWSDSLALMAAVVANDSMQSLLANPRLTREGTGGLVIRACGDDIGEGEIADREGVGVVLTSADRVGAGHRPNIPGTDSQ